MPLTAEQKEIRKLRKHLLGLTKNVTSYVNQLDRLMNTPTTKERGEKIAHLSNQLVIANDIARHHGLGQSLRSSSGQNPLLKSGLQAG